jgi:hypothetical protein
MTKARVDEFVFHILQVMVIQIESPFQCPIRYPFLTLEQFEYLGEDVIEGHGVTLHCASFRCFVPLR